MYFPTPGSDYTLFLFEIANIPSSFSGGKSPHPPRQFHQPTCICAHVHWLSARRKCTCSPLWHPLLVPYSSLLKILKLFALAITDFLSCIIFFSFSTGRFPSMYYYPFYKGNSMTPPDTTEFLSTPHGSPKLVHIVVFIPVVSHHQFSPHSLP